MKKLFSPIKIGSLELKNRIAIPAMHLGYSENGLVSDQLIRFYSERARGGAGLIIVGGAYVHPLGIGGIHFMAIDDDKYIPGLKDLADAIRADGAKSSIQLFHAGRYAYSFLIGEAPVSASDVRSPMSGDTPRPLTVDEIKEMVGFFTDGARRAKEAGFDSVEISGATGYLVSQFLSPFTNRRDDEYGGSAKKRMRFAEEIIQSIKSELGDDYPVIFRLTFDDLVQGGNGIEPSKLIAKGLEKAGADALDMQVGWHESRVPTIAMSVPRAVFSYLARDIMKEVDIPVMTTNRLNNPVQADELIQDRAADIIGMGRPLIADPYLPVKAMEGRLDEIRTCIACNQGCFDGVLTGRPVACMINPEAGREKEFEVKPAEKSKKIMVIGAGPGGIEAATTLADRGHEVTLYEKNEGLGGKLNFCHLPPNRKEFIGYLDYLSARLDRSNVNVVTGVEVSKSFVNDESPDVVVLATGASQIVPDIPGGDKPHVYLAEAVLKGEADLGENIVIIGGGAVGCETAMLAIKRGEMPASTAQFLVEQKVMSSDEAAQLIKPIRSVTVIDMLDKLGVEFGRSYRWVIMQSLRQNNVDMMPQTKCLEITDTEVIVESNGQEKAIQADTVVIAVGYSSENGLAVQLDGKVPELHVIGDASQPRKILEAVYEGAKIAREI